jgi:2-polyprenyl-3-methyl-5-hydroxy-6-metoxy-1,4-benzoquinol methylase
MDIAIILSIIFGVFGVAESISAIIAFRNEKRQQRMDTENLLFELQEELTTGETWEMLNKKPVDEHYLILTLERVINKFELLKKVANQNSPAIQSIIRNIHYIDNLISDEQKNGNDEWSRVYKNAKNTLINKLERINIVSDYYGKEYSELASYQALIGEKLIKMGGDFANIKKLLDFGCGDGRDGIKIATQNPYLQVDGFDASTELVKIANNKKEKQEIQNVNFWVEDANNFNEKNEYDVIFSNFVIHWVGLDIIDRIYEALKDNGKLLFSVSAKNSYKEFWGDVEKRNGVIWQAIDNLGFKRYFKDYTEVELKPSEIEVKNKLKQLNFKNISFQTVVQDRTKLNKSLKDAYLSTMSTKIAKFYTYIDKKQQKQLSDEALRICLSENIKIQSLSYLVYAEKKV